MKIFKIIYYVFLGFIAAIALLLVVSIFPITGNIKFMVVQSGSMEPAIHTGSVVMVRPVSDYKVGDIITFGQVSKTKAPTTHRILEIKTQGGQTTYLTKGDANNAADTREISKNEIIGRVSFSVPYAGYAVAAARKPLGFALIVVVPAAIIIYDEARKIIKEIGKMRNKKKEKLTETEKDAKA